MEDHVKDLVKEWLDSWNAWSYAPIQNGMGVHGIPDRIACFPVIVTPSMVGKRIGLFIGIEAKRPGRRPEKNRGMSAAQNEIRTAILEAAGLSICCDGHEDIAALALQLYNLLTKPA
ncbi:MAG: hypothetical protein ACYDBH_00370 [Acidobacteriaceae bacterium]